jgi:hypothetical protein
MEPILILFLVHFIADFPLQTNQVYHLKQSSFGGVLIHSAVHPLVALLITGFRLDLWYVWLFLLVSHAITDWTKLKYPSGRQWVSFLIDQAVHLFVMVLIAIWQPALTTPLPSWLLYLSFCLAWMPAGLMFGWVLAGDAVQSLPHPSSRVVWMQRNLLHLSRLSGYPIVALVLIGLIFQNPP